MLYIWQTYIGPLQYVYVFVFNYYFQQLGDFKCIIVLVGMSLVQGGSGLPFFAPSLYDYISGKDVCKIQPIIEEIPDASLRTIVTEV